ncbi:MAG: conjugal transfer protein TraX [Azoarcus sp. PHD]|nr:MAG: conjugal transfer protein TraX [Azoarcus sp. PHD]
MSDTARAAPGQAPAFELPRIVVADGTLEALKWLALALMTLDHANKYLLRDAVPALFAVGRLAMPLFGFVLAYNLARAETLAAGVYSRVLQRLAIYGTLATVPCIALGGIAWGWWPLNIMAMMFVATGVMFLVEKGGKANFALAVLLFVLGGGIVEFWWPGVALCLAAWRYCKRPSWSALIFWIGALASLFIINSSLWALAVLPLVLVVAPRIDLNMPRLSRVFYAYYPAHLVVLWVLTRHS